MSSSKSRRVESELAALLIAAGHHDRGPEDSSKVRKKNRWGRPPVAGWLAPVAAWLCCRWPAGCPASPPGTGLFANRVSPASWTGSFFCPRFHLGAPGCPLSRCPLGHPADGLLPTTTTLCLFLPSAQTTPVSWGSCHLGSCVLDSPLPRVPPPAGATRCCSADTSCASHLVAVSRSASPSFSL